MPKKRRFQVKVTVAMPEELYTWLDECVRNGIFANISQGLRRCVAIAREYIPEGKKDD